MIRSTSSTALATAVSVFALIRYYPTASPHRDAHSGRSPGASSGCTPVHSIERVHAYCVPLGALGVPSWRPLVPPDPVDPVDPVDPAEPVDPADPPDNLIDGSF